MAKAQNEQAIYENAELRLTPTGFRQWCREVFTPEP